MRVFSWGILCISLLFSPVSFGDQPDLEQIEKELTTTGVHGWIHGAAHDLKEYVFTYRDQGFFNAVEFSLTTKDPKVAQVMGTLNRNDEVLIQGAFAKNPSPQKHIVATSIKVLKKFEGEKDVPPYLREAKLPEELKAAHEFIGKVHAVAAEGKILVLEYKDAVVPLFAEDPSLTRELYRNDKVRVHYIVQKGPRLPTHLKLDPSVEIPLQVLERIADGHGKTVTLEGVLVKFPQSPQILFDVYALQLEDSDRVVRDYTLVNFEDPETFAAIREKLAKVWDAQRQTQENGRNKLINKKIRVKATGILNVVAPNQANPQVLLDGPDKVEFIQ